MSLGRSIGKISQTAGRVRGFAKSSKGFDAFLSIPETKTTLLGNGMRVASENSNGEVASLSLFIDAGSRHDQSNKQGLVNLLQQVAFKGTHSRTFSSLESEIEKIGGKLSSEATREHISFTAHVLKKDVPKAIEILSDVIQNNSLNISDIESEKAKIIKDIQDSENNIEENVFSLLHQTAFQGSDLSRPITGTTESVGLITREDLSSFISNNFVGPRVVLAAAGGVSHDELVKLSEKHFSALSKNLVPRENSKPRFYGSEIRMRNDENPQAHIVLSFEGASAVNPDLFELKVAQHIIGSYDKSFGGASLLSSKLSQDVDHYHACDSFNTFHKSYTDTGIFGVYVVSPQKTMLDDLIYLVQKELVRVSVNANESEVERAKNQLKASLLMGLNESASVSQEIGKQLLTIGRRMTPFELNTRISSITAKSVRDVCYKYLYDKEPAVVGYGPIEAMPDYNRVNVATSWVRL